MGTTTRSPMDLGYWITNSWTWTAGNSSSWQSSGSLASFGSSNSSFGFSSFGSSASLASSGNSLGSSGSLASWGSLGSMNSSMDFSLGSLASSGSLGSMKSSMNFSLGKSANLFPSSQDGLSVFLAIGAVALLCCLIGICGCCFFCWHPKRKRSQKVVIAAEEGRSGARRWQRTGDAMANEEGLRDDSPLLSERPEPKYASTKAKMLATGMDWRHEAPLNREILPGPSAYLSPSAASYYDYYGGVPGASYYDYYGGVPGYASGYAAGVSGFPSPYLERQVDRLAYANPSSPYLERQVDRLAYANPSSPYFERPMDRLAYANPYGGTFVDHAPMPLLNPPPQYMPQQAGNFMRPY